MTDELDNFLANLSANVGVMKTQAIKESGTPSVRHFTKPVRVKALEETKANSYPELLTKLHVPDITEVAYRHPSQKEETSGMLLKVVCPVTAYKCLCGEEYQVVINMLGTYLTNGIKTTRLVDPLTVSEKVNTQYLTTSYRVVVRCQSCLTSSGV